MAKQSGIHGIRGKVGEYSYYKQSGIAAGLIRRIPEGLSSRVKNDEAYANTRLSNNEFGAAANVSGLLGQMVEPKFRPMILPFSQSNMAKAILELARQSSLPWGARVVSSDDTAELAAILTSQSKLPISNFFGITLTPGSENHLMVEISYNAAQASLMASLGITHITVRVTPINVATGQFNNVTGKIQRGYIRKLETAFPFDLEALDPEGDGTNDEFTIPPFTPTPVLYYGHQFISIVALPARQVGGRMYTLQEYCSFQAFQVPTSA